MSLPAIREIQVIRRTSPIRILMTASWTIAAAGGFLPQGTGQLLLVVGVVGVGLVLTMSIRAKIARRNAETPSAREQIDALKASSKARTEVDMVHAALHESARKLMAQLDNKAMRLELLIDQADERLARLQAAGASNEASHQPTAHTSAQSIASAARPRAPMDDTASAAAPRETIRRNDSIASHHPEPTDALRRAIYALADRGRTPNDIARELDEHIGKIELILALRSG